LEGSPFLGLATIMPVGLLLREYYCSKTQECRQVSTEFCTVENSYFCSTSIIRLQLLQPTGDAGQLARLLAHTRSHPVLATVHVQPPTFGLGF